ncbi:hypothetical protein Tco_0066095 [Tanacetum coccineum]
MHSEGDDPPLTKLSNTVTCTYKFRIEIPDIVINNAFKQLVGYKYYKAKKAESGKVKATKEPEEQYVSLVKSGKGKGYMCSVELAKSISISEQRTQQRRRSQLIIDRQIDNDVANYVSIVGMKNSKVRRLKIQQFSPVRLTKRIKASRLESVRKKKRNTSKESANETDDADDLDIALTDDEPNE